MENIYDKMLLLRQFTKGAQMACKDDKKLDKFEPEHDDRTWTRNNGHIFLICIISFMIINIIASSINQIGTRKS